MSLENIETQIQQKLTMAGDLKARAKLDFGDDGALFIDSTQTPAVITQDDLGDVDVTLSCKKEVFEGFLDGTQNPNMAFMMGKLKVKGSMGLAMKLNAMLED